MGIPYKLHGSPLAVRSPRPSSAPTPMRCCATSSATTCPRRGCRAPRARRAHLVGVVRARSSVRLPNRRISSKPRRFDGAECARMPRVSASTPSSSTSAPAGRSRTSCVKNNAAAHAALGTSEKLKFASTAEREQRLRRGQEHLLDLARVELERPPAAAADAVGDRSMPTRSVHWLTFDETSARTARRWPCPRSRSMIATMNSGDSDASGASHCTEERTPPSRTRVRSRAATRRTAPPRSGSSSRRAGTGRARSTRRPPCRRE
jgi:hypothetical protein